MRPIVPTVAFRLRHAGRSLDVVLCFGCDEVNFVLRDERGRPVHAAVEDVDPARAKLVTLAREAFPDDPAIRALRPVK